MIRRPVRFGLVLVSLAGAAVASVACSGSGGGGTTTPTPPPPFVPDGCQIVWMSEETAAAPSIVDVMLLDVPIGDWAVGTHAYAAAGPRGLFYKHYDLSTGAFTARAIEQTGSFQLFATSTSSGGFVHFVDDTAQELVLVDTAGNPVASEGTSGTGSFFGPLSDPFAQNVLPGSGAMSVVFAGTAEQLGHDLSYAVCYHGSPPP